MKYKIKFSEISKHKKGIIISIIVFLVACTLIFLLVVLSEARQQYLYYGGQANELTVGKILSISRDYFRQNYFKSADQEQQEIELARRQELARLNLPMNQQIRRTFFYGQPYLLSLAMPKSWEGRYVAREAGNRLELSLTKGASFWPLFVLQLVDRQDVQKKDEDRVILKNEAVAVLLDRKKPNLNSLPVDKFYKIALGESEEVIKSLKVYKNR